MEQFEKTITQLSPRFFKFTKKKKKNLLTDLNQIFSINLAIKTNFKLQIDCNMF